MNKEPIKNNIRFILSIFLTTTLVIGLVFLIFASIGTSFKFDNQFWFRFVTGSIITLLVISFWIPAGKEKGEKDKKFIDNKNSYNERANKISKNQEHKKLSIYCKYRTEEKKYEKINRMLSNVVLDYEEYVKLVQAKATKEQVLANETWNKKQKKVLIRLLNREVRVVEDKPAQITTGIDNYKGESLHNQEKIREVFYIIARIVLNFATMFFLASFIITEKDVGLADIAQLFIWFMAIATNLVGSYMYGVKSIVVFRNQYYIRLCDFLSKFDEWLINPMEHHTEYIKLKIKNQKKDTK